MHDFRSRQRKQPCQKATLLGTASGHSLVNLPGWCWAEIQQFALVGSSSSLHSEACNALGASDGVIHSRISQEAVSLRATANSQQTHLTALQQPQPVYLRMFVWCKYVCSLWWTSLFASPPPAHSNGYSHALGRGWSLLLLLLYSQAHAH